MPKEYIISIDLGTTSEKCVIYDTTGEVVAEAQKDLEIIYPGPGQAEIPSQQFYDLTCANIRDCINNNKINPKELVVIIIDSLMGGVIGIDKNYNPVTYYDTCLDTRDADESNYVLENFGNLVLEKNGSNSVWGHKLLYWKKKNEWKDIVKFIQPAAFVAGKLAGLKGKDAFIDQSFLSFSCLSNLENSEWSFDLASKLRIDISKLPRIVKATDIIGYITRSSSEDTGIPIGLPVCAGCGDVTAGFIGAGLLGTGKMVDISGTANILGVNIDQYKYNENIACIKSPINESYYLMSNVMGGKTHNWFTNEFYSYEKDDKKKSGNDIYKYLDELAGSLNPGSDGLIALVDLQGRFFPPDPNMRGMFLGHTWSHKKIHFYRAILEAVAYDHYFTRGIFLRLMPELKFKNVIAVGSGANSKPWLKIKSDVMQLPFVSLSRTDISTLGSCVIAGYAAGLFKDVENTINKFLKIKTVVKPDLNMKDRYSRYISMYIDFLGILKKFYEKY